MKFSPVMSSFKTVRLNPVRVLNRKALTSVGLPLALAGSLLSGCNSASNPTAESPTPAANQALTVGMVIVGPKDDSGWNQSHYEGMQAVAKDIPGVKFEYVEKVNPGDNPNLTAVQAGEQLLAKGAKVVIFNSDDFKNDALELAKKHPDVAVIHAAGDYAWKEGKNYKSLPNLSNISARMEYGKMMSGCAAALGTKTGKIGYLGPLVNEETRRYASAAYLGAKYCWENYLKKNAADLQFKVTWIGFWFNIPGKTLDPVKVADEYYNTGYDVVISGIDTPEASQQAKKAAASGKNAKYVHYDFKQGCDIAPAQCLGVSYYNWNVAYGKSVQAIMDGKSPSPFVWLEPEWQDINNSATSMVSFVPGQGLDNSQKGFLKQYIQGLASGSIIPYRGPLNFKDGSVFLKAGEDATDSKIWYQTKLLKGMEERSK